MEKKDNKLKGNYTTHIIGSTLLVLVIVIICLIHFYQYNEKRLVKQAEDFLAESAYQKADFVSLSMNERVCQIENYAFLYGLDFLEDRIHSERLKELEQGILFDYVRFIDTNGIDYTSDGSRLDISEREYFQKAIKGESGLVSIVSKVTGAKVIGSYAPVYSKGEIVGVLVGFQEQESVSEMLSARVNGQEVSVYLITPEGEILGSSKPEETREVENVSQFTNPDTFHSETEREEAMKAISEGRSIVVNFNNIYGNDASVCIQPVEGTDWFLIESLPESMIENLMADYTASTTILFVIIVIMFFVYILIAILTAVGNMKRDKVLDEERGRSEELVQLSCTDELTGLLNRHAYERDVEAYSDNYDEDFVYISVDLNGLKIINDNLGHASGDALIKAAAECIGESTKNYGKSYRIGGDEFVAMISASDERVSGIIADIEARASQWVGEAGDRLSLSIGFAEQRDFSYMNIVQLAKVADQRMYNDKANYYKRKGFDRRGRDNSEN